MLVLNWKTDLRHIIHLCLPEYLLSITAVLPSLFRDVTRRKLVVGYRRFRSAYRSHVEGTQLKGTLEDRIVRLSHSLGNQLPT